MKSIKNVFMTGVVLAIALFTSVQVNAMSTIQQQITNLEANIKSKETALANYTRQYNEIVQAKAKGMVINLEELASVAGSIAGCEIYIEDKQKKINKLKEAQKLESILKNQKEKLAQVETMLKSRPEERPFHQKYIAEQQQSIKEIQAKIDALVKN